MKTMFKILALAVIIGFIFTACPNSPSSGGGGGGGGGKQPTTESHHIEVDSTELGLDNAGKKITVIFPLTGTTASERTTMKDRLTAAFGEFDAFAEIDPTFKAKMNPILERAGNFKITVRVDATMVTIEGNQMFLGSAWLLHPGVDHNMIAGEITSAVMNDLIVAMNLSKDTVRNG